MKLIIDISKATQKIIHDHGEVGIHMSAEKLLKAIQHGTPLDDVFDKLESEIEQNAYPIVHGVNNHEKGMTLYGILQVIDKYKTENDHKCHNCKHYTRGERDGSCDSYICKHYSGWESEG